ncbi:MAG: PIG-L family deacetylase [Clostridia bacterium]|nr:PIG-L family deacetylase [Clostridia bacterium]
MRDRLRKLLTVLILTAVSVLLALPQNVNAENNSAENLSAKCKYSGDFTVHADRLTDADFDSAQRINKGKTLSIQWNDSVPVASVFISFYYEPVAYTVMQFDGAGQLLSEEPGVLLYNNLIETLTETRKVSIRADADNCALCSLYAFGEGDVPDYHAFAPTAEKADYMTFAMHPDDDVLFLGAVYPLYDAERGLTGVSMIMSTKLPEKIQRQRRQEDLNGAWILGLKTQPIFGGFPDIPQDYYKQFHHTFTTDDVTRYAVAQIRKYRPEVVITQDLNGEYGHWQHKVLSEGVLAAVPLAADPDYQPKGYPQSEPWEVKKLYIHLYADNKLTLDVDRPIVALNGKTAFECATEAFQCHLSQIKKDNHHVSKTEYSIADFGLAYTTVGADTPGVNDMFEHVDPYTLSVTPTPEPTSVPMPEPTPTEESTAVPTLPPTIVPAESPTPIMTVDETETPVTPVPTEAATPLPTGETQTEGSGLQNSTILLIGGGLVLLLVLLLILLLIVRKRR